MYISIVCFIKLTSSNGYKSKKFVSLIDAPYFKNAFAPGASIRRNTYAYVLKNEVGRFNIFYYFYTNLAESSCVVFA